MKSFLIIEDYDKLAKSCMILIKHKYKDAFVSHAKNGQEALEMIRRLDYTIIISDINMPVMNGVEFFKELKSVNPNLAGRVGIISSYSKEDSNSSFLISEGCPYLMKAFSTIDFYNFLDSLLNSVKNEFVNEYGYECMRREVRFKLSDNCTISPLRTELSKASPIKGKVYDHSKGGLGIKYEGVHLPFSRSLAVSVPSLEISDKLAKIAWVEPVGATFKAGLQWA